MSIAGFLRSAARAPVLAPLLRSYRAVRRAVREARPARDAFQRIYAENLWGSSESRSGLGSTMEATREIRAFLPPLLARLGVRSLLDAPCGDFQWMRHVDLDLDQYIGADLVPELIDRLQRDFGTAKRRFIVADITEDPLPAVDAILCRHCLIHLSNRRARRAVDNFLRGRARWLLTTSYRGVSENLDIETGSFRRIDLRLPPFSLGEPEESLVDGGDEDARLDVYDLDRLRSRGARTR